MKIWDSRRGRLAEFGFDLRGTWVHKLAWKLFRYRNNPVPPHKKHSSMTKADLKAWRKFHHNCALDCFCEPCVRKFLPWPLSW